MADTSIEWTDKTWNPTRGCKRVSPGCKNCYAERMAMRFSGPGQPYEGLVTMTSQGPKWTGIVREVPDMLDSPMHWRKPVRVFVDSMSDLFEEQVSDSFIDKVFAVMALCQRHTFQILTKRPERMREYFAAPDRAVKVQNVVDDMETWDGNFIPRDQPAPMILNRWPLPNVWLGVSVESQEYADERIPLLLETPAAVRFISAEPLLGPIDLTRVCDRRTQRACWMNVAEAKEDNPAHPQLLAHFGGDYESPRLDWVIAGGESGPGARPQHPAWFASLRDQCASHGVPFLFKQWGEHIPVETDCGTEGRREVVAAEGCGDLPDGRYQVIKFEGIELAKAGKKRAGRLLDGRTWDGFPT